MNSCGLMFLDKISPFPYKEYNICAYFILVKIVNKYIFTHRDYKHLMQHVCMCVCWPASQPALPSTLSPLLGRARSSPPVYRCHGWTSSFTYICMPSNGAAADSFQSRLSSWTPAQSCWRGNTGRWKGWPDPSVSLRPSLRHPSLDTHQLQ